MFMPLMGARPRRLFAQKMAASSRSSAVLLGSSMMAVTRADSGVFRPMRGFDRRKAPDRSCHLKFPALYSKRLRISKFRRNDMSKPKEPCQSGVGLPRCWSVMLAVPHATGSTSKSLGLRGWEK